MTEKEYLICLSTFVPFGPARIKLLLSYFGSAKKIWTAPPKTLKELGLGQERIQEFIRHRDSLDISAYFNRLNKFRIKYLTINDGKYPANLKEISDAPFVLYFKGEIKSGDENAIAIVGTRKITSYGKEVTERFSGELSSFGVTIISGLARGVDTFAHRSAIASHGRTFAVVGSGLDNIYPPENLALAGEIEKHGALISEYPLGYPALPINFPTRNRLVSGLSKAVLVIEGAAKSGTLLTASHAADQGKAVFAVPGQITSPLSAAPLFLLKNGAKLATTTNDILEELDLEVRVDREKMEKVMPSTKDEGQILKILENEPLHLDELARISTLDVSKISARLTIMELKGMVKNIGNGVYKKV